MLSVSSWTLSQLGYKVTRPQYLISLKVNDFTYYYATRKTVTWDSKEWVKQKGLEVSFTSNGPNLPDSAQLRFLNKNLEFSTTLLSSNLEHEVSISLTYGNKLSYTETDVIRRFRGLVVSMEASDHNLVIMNCEVRFMKTGKLFPSLRFGPPFCNHLPAIGEEFQWGSKTIIVGE